jgi:hypothetical protein
VLISPRVVVTAGHCVCRKRQLDTADTERVTKSVGKAFLSRPDAEKSAVLKEVLDEAATVIDSTDCAGLSIVSVTTYPPTTARRRARDSADLSYSVREYKGEALAHDELMILYDENGWTVFKEVDLAVIVLKKPVQGVAQTVRLARSEAQSGEVVVMVGYGLGDDDENAKTYGDRYVGESQIVKVAPSESGNLQFLTGGQTRDGGTAASVYGGDSGAPCFRKTGELIGLASAYMEDEAGEKLSIFTSIYPHREWLRKIIADAR